jgi:imidazolonepropionase-like amidohydrolase
VDVGKRADFVLLDANPLRDIANAWRIHAVILGGRLLRRAELDALLVAP